MFCIQVYCEIREDSCCLKQLCNRGLWVMEMDVWMPILWSCEMSDENLRGRKDDMWDILRVTLFAYIIFWFGAALAWKMVWDLGLRWKVYMRICSNAEPHLNYPLLRNETRDLDGKCLMPTFNLKIVDNSAEVWYEKGRFAFRGDWFEASTKSIVMWKCWDRRFVEVWCSADAVHVVFGHMH